MFGSTQISCVDPSDHRVHITVESVAPEFAYELGLSSRFLAGSQTMHATGYATLSVPDDLATELSLWLLASNRLISVPRLDGTIGNTGDTHGARYRVGSLSGVWRPEQGNHYPQMSSSFLDVRLTGANNVVATKELGQACIEPASKPPLRILLSGAPDGALFGAQFDAGASGDPYADNVGLTAYVKTLTAGQYGYTLRLTSRAPASDGTYDGDYCQ